MPTPTAPEATRAGTLARWGAVVVWIALAPLLVSAGMQPELHRGAIVNVEITLLPSDAGQLSCSLDSRPAGYACAFSRDGRPAPPSPLGTLVPCLTVDRVELLVPDLFAQPAIAQRVASGQGRFTARCRARVVERVFGVRTRYASGRDFGTPVNAWITAPVACTVH